MPEILYLDYNCFQRGFDDQRQVRIRLEADACDGIFHDAENGAVELVWSFMHADENALCPFPDRKIEVGRLAGICTVFVKPGMAIRKRAKELVSSAGVSPKDALHLAASEHAKAAWFVTCDDELVRKAKGLTIAPRIVNPVHYVMLKR